MFQTTKHLYGSNERSCIYVLKVSPLSLPPIFLLDFELFPTVWYFCFSFSFYQLLCSSYIYSKKIYLSHKMSLSVLNSWFKKKVNNFWDLRFGKREWGIFSRVPMTDADRSEHPFMSICDLHHQLLLSKKKWKLLILLHLIFWTAYKRRFTFICSYFQDMVFLVEPPPPPSANKKNKQTKNKQTKNKQTKTKTKNKKQKQKQK